MTFRAVYCAPNSYDQSEITVEPCRAEEELGVQESPFTLTNFSFESLYSQEFYFRIVVMLT